jgi:hypothetical protein
MFGSIIFVTVLLFALGQLGDLSPSHLFALLTYYCLAVFAALLVDVDQRNSLIWRLLNVLLLTVLIVWTISTYGFSLTHLGIAALIFLFWYFIASKLIVPRHRGIIHSILFDAVLSVFVFVASGFNFMLALVFFVGFYSHMVLDGYFFKWV